jgi:hypothetical protein
MHLLIDSYAHTHTHTHTHTITPSHTPSHPELTPGLLSSDVLLQTLMLVLASAQTSSRRHSAPSSKRACMGATDTTQDCKATVYVSVRR